MCSEKALTSLKRVISTGCFFPLTVRVFCSQKCPSCFSYFNFGVEAPWALPFLTERLPTGSLNPLLTGMFFRIESFLLIFLGLSPRLSAAFVWEQRKQIYYSVLSSLRGGLPGIGLTAFAWQWQLLLSSRCLTILWSLCCCVCILVMSFCNGNFVVTGGRLLDLVHWETGR